jgi:phosphatidylglycerophosphate synthase
MLVFLDNLRSRLAYLIAEYLAKTGVTPNQVTIFRFVVSWPAVLYLFSRGEYLSNLWGLLIYVLLVPLDWVDGHLARLTHRASPLGKFLDDTLDRILLLSVLGSLFYAKINTDPWRGGILTLVFFVVYFFLTALLEDFDQTFNLDFARYAEIEQEVLVAGKISWMDRLGLNFLNVHRNSLSKFSFCISYPLFLGLLLNQVFLTFVFLIFTFALRSFGIMLLLFLTLRGESSSSVLVKVLRQRYDQG